MTLSTRRPLSVARRSALTAAAVSPLAAKRASASGATYSTSRTAPSRSADKHSPASVSAPSNWSGVANRSARNRRTIVSAKAVRVRRWHGRGLIQRGHGGGLDAHAVQPVLPKVASADQASSRRPLQQLVLPLLAVAVTTWVQSRS